MWKFFKDMVLPLVPVFVVASVVILLFFPKIPTVFEFLQIAFILTVLLVLALSGIYYAYEGIKKLVKRVLNGKTVARWEIRDMEDIVLMHAIDPDHPGLRPFKKAYSEGLEKEIELLEEENKKLRENTNNNND